MRLRRLRGALVAAQLAIAALVLVCAGLLARSMANAGSLDLGFRTDSLLMASVDLSIAGRDSARAAAFFAEAERRVRALPGVRAAALAAHTPLGYFNGTLKLVPAQRTPTVPPEGLTVFANPVGTDYFRAMGQRLLAGREFSERDDAAAPPVLIVNEALARRLWPGEDPLGQRVRVGDDGRVALVVGLARTATYNFLNEAPLPFAYVPYRQHRRDAMTFFVHTAGDPDALAPALRAVVRELDPDAPLYDVRSMRDHLVNGRALLFVRLGAAIAAAFGVLALTLATVGAYGVVAYSASQRTREIGIRVAFGARAGRVARLLVGQGLALAAVGVGSGIGAAAAAGRALSALLYDVRPGDPVVFGAVAALLAAVVALASLVPAWRAARLDPTVALRSEG
jgi:predicted permease